MNLPPAGEEVFLICMALSILAGILIGIAIGYRLKEKRHAAEIAAVVRLATFQRQEKERAPKDPPKITLYDQLFV